MNNNRQPLIEVIPAKASHVRTIAKRMRKSDADEVMAASGKSPGAALVYTLRKSTKAWTALVDGRPEVMFGVVDISILAGVGAPWLLGTDAVEKHYVAFLRQSVWFRSQLLSDYSVLKNFVDVRNKASIRWLKWLGFSFHDPFEYRGYTFRLFELRSDDVRYCNGTDTRVNAARRGGTSSVGEGPFASERV